MSTTTVSKPSPSGSWSPGGFPSTTPSGRHEITTPPSVGQAATPFRAGNNNIDSQPLRDASPSYFNIVGDSSTFHIHFPPQISRDATPLVHPSIYTRGQRPFQSTPGPDVSGSNILPASWQSSSTLSTQHHDSDKTSGVAATPFYTPPAWPWKGQFGNAEQTPVRESQKLIQKEGHQLKSPQDRKSSPLQPPIPTVHVTRPGPSRPFDQGSLPAMTSAPALSPYGSGLPSLQRSETSPASVDNGSVKMISSQCCKDLLSTKSDVTLVLDIRPYPQYSQGRIKGSLNLCIPTTLLKRPSFNLEKLKDTLAGDDEKEKFSNWHNSSQIVVYDAATTLIKDASALVNVLKKFTNEGWSGEPMILRGGFSQFSVQFPDLVEKKPDETPMKPPKQPLSISLSFSGPSSISGGCLIPPSTPSLNPMYNSIRQSTELVNGVGQIPIKLPSTLTERARNSLPSWLAKAADVQDNGKSVSNKFLAIEKAEQCRMQEALSDSGTYGSATAQGSKSSYRIAGLEQGNKNRYNNIYPYEHCRVRLGSTVQGSCDYVNASYVKASRSNKLYIATQAPLPSTFKDFWHVVWEQDARLIVMLTAESEGLQLKCHPYWQSNAYGPFRVTLMNEYKVPLHVSPLSPNKRTHSRRESTGPSSFEELYMIVRHLTIIHESLPFEPLREITQIQYSHWPDFGTPSRPAHLLRVIEETNKFSNASNGRGPECIQDPEPPDPRKIIVHCSAGCGRTGTFCTIDSVIDMLKRQRRRGEGEDGWVYRDDLDLIASTVEDFRCQRLSMVQSLRQFVLCYESILEWLASQPENKEN
ncbi:Protein-tyrosine phosphatase domain containing protein [Coccidioides posadasii C735 delta SOWgp]|uniref:protein-tyrosine-phosphatase n=2 Tax=Coccidioides posadasii TaxID=199306 RepID=C5P3P2_COCP7|nr:Protein-tyrosine phosphatase domain containing protein [Coccidioides posadasii C735 delta SOWgp]EER28310.1 Protein-tyrosine phosphatase domain containing protein [Coccidioides posadasii C735 delta SOWgp]|eukprot:XP_003070455.1 Protein-tyrosine phosphatase domain containing protein [Coccidioides posadasii C735 delta SOWgp]